MSSKRDLPLLAHVRVWMPPRRSRGPVPAYSREQIADAAITIADESGLAVVTMRNVAAALGTGPMSLYRYVENKDALIALMGDRMVGRYGWSELTGDWRVDLREVARGQRRVVLAHPWLARVWWSRPSLGPNMLRAFERGMSILGGLGLDVDDMVETIELINTWISGYVRAELDAKTFFGGACREDVQRALEPYIASLVDSGDYPYFTRFVVEASTPHLGKEERFERALDRIMAGLEATLPATR